MTRTLDAVCPNCGAHCPREAAICGLCGERMMLRLVDDEPKPKALTYSCILGAMLQELAEEREFEFCGRVSVRLWREGRRDATSMKVREAARDMLANPHRCCL